MTTFPGVYPLMLAAHRGQDAVVARLLALGADVGLQSVRGSSATHWACSGKQSSSLGLLLDAGASMDSRDEFGRTPLLVAAAHGLTDSVALLLERFGARVKEQLRMVNNHEDTAAHLACWFNRPSTLATLLDAGASTTARNNLGRTPLMMAAAYGATDCVALLLEKCACALPLDLDVQDSGGLTALQWAANQEHPQIISLLLHAGADPTIKTRWREMPFGKAQARGQQECVALLETALAEP